MGRCPYVLSALLADLRETQATPHRICLPKVRALQPVCAVGARGTLEVWLTRRTRTLAGVPAHQHIIANTAAAADGRSARRTERRGEFWRTVRS